jgi:regulatory protein
MKRSREYTEVKAKLESYCAYQERCTFEVKEKLKEFNLNELEIISIIEELKNDNYLNEERFARSYASGKFVIKSWGKNKIKSHLSAKRVSKDLIETALNAIDYNEYTARLLYLSRKKELELVKEKNGWTRKQKIMRYLVSKGFETHLIYEALGNHDAQ